MPGGNMPGGYHPQGHEMECEDTMDAEDCQAIRNRGMCATARGCARTCGQCGQGMNTGGNTSGGSSSTSSSLSYKLVQGGGYCRSNNLAFHEK